MVEKMAVESNPENPEQAIQDIAVNVPIKRLAKPTEVGELFAFLGSDEASYITGEQIVTHSNFAHGKHPVCLEKST